MSANRWQAVECHDRSSIPIVDSLGKAVVPALRNTPQNLKRARLIAAAPELMDACEALVRYDDYEPGGGEANFLVAFQKYRAAVDLAKLAIAKVRMLPK